METHTQSQFHDFKKIFIKRFQRWIFKRDQFLTTEKKNNMIVYILHALIRENAKRNTNADIL